MTWPFVIVASGVACFAALCGVAALVQLAERLIDATQPGIVDD